jgi:MFS transporter, NNP family, nitrate/nitrite transporter
LGKIRRIKRVHRRKTTLNTLKVWNPEDPIFWDEYGNRAATRNLVVSFLSLHLAFCIWQVWSVMTVNLPNVGFQYTANQMFTLTALPALSGGILRMFYSLAVTFFGGRTWTVISTALLLIPAIGIGVAVQNPNTSFTTMAVLSALCGFGGANFTSSMANIGPFYPKEKQGLALGINGGIGNLGVSVVQLITPIIILYPLFPIGGSQTMMLPYGSRQVWIQNGAWLWVIPIVVVTILAYFYMDNLPGIRVPLVEQLRIFKRKHMYIITILYIMSFGSFIGFSAAFPLLLMQQFPEVNALQYAFIGPLLGASFRTIGGYLADKFGGAIVTFVSVIVMVVGTMGLVFFTIEGRESFIGFFLTFLVLFMFGGIANGSIFRMIPFIFGPKETSPAIGFCGAIGAFGGFFIPKMFGWSIEMTGGAHVALYVFIGYYVLCSGLLWYYYARPKAEIKI